VHQATIQAKPATVNVSLKLSSFGLGYDSRHALLICLHAAEGVPLRDVQQHLVKCTHHVVTESLHALLSNTAIADAEDPLPLEIGAPIPFVASEEGYQCKKCQLAFTAPFTQPKKKINKHIRDAHGGCDAQIHPCFIQRWFGGDSSYRTCSDPAQMRWRYVVMDPHVPAAVLAPPSLSCQLELFEQIAPPSTHPEITDVIDRRELGAVIHRLNLMPFASVEVMRAHHASCHVGHGIGLEGPDLFSLCREWIMLVQRVTDTLPDQVRCWLATLL
jgi:hypothetical protein